MSARPRQPARPHRLAVEPLEDRVTPAYSATFAGFTSTWTGNSSGGTGDIVIFSRDSGTGNLIHNRFVAGDAGFNSAQDFDSTVAGDQTLGANTANDVRITTGASSLEEVRIGGSVGGQSAAASQLLAVFIVTPGAGGQTLLVDDSLATADTTYTVSATAVTSPSILVSRGGTFADVRLNAGTGNDTIRVTGSTAGEWVGLNGSDGNDGFEFSDGVTARGGTLFGGAGTDTISFAGYTTPVAVNLGLGVSGLTAALDGGQENPGTGSTASGTAALTNYNATTKTFDLAITVTGLAPADVTGFHFHRGGVGVNGPVVRDLLGLAPLVSAGTGFTFTLTGVALSAFTGGVANEAALLGGQLYLNIHTAAAPGGLIRGQVFSTANVNLTNGTATGTGGITQIENATGGTLDDSLVGSFAANTLRGQGGNDTILGGPGADTFSGESGNDVMIWSNGDGSDVMDGSTGNDTVAVNGSLTADDVFTIGANGTRVAFARVSPGPFTLDIGTTETLTVNGIVGNDSFTMNALTGVADLTAIGLFGLAGNDTFAVTPFTGTTTVGGGVGTDTLTVSTTGTTNPFITLAADIAGGRIGGFAFGNRGAVNFAQTENPAGPANFVTVTKTDGLTTATAGASIVYTVTVTNTSTLGVNGIRVTDVLPAALTGVTWTAVFTPGSTGTTAGSGNINQVVNLAAGGGVTYTVTATIDPAFVGTLTNTASAAVPAGLTDDTAADDTSTDDTQVVLPPPPPPVVPPPPPVADTDLFAVATGPGVPVRVNVFNADGTLRFHLTPFGGFTGGATASTGDVTGDGIDDIAVAAGASGGPHVKVFDGATGAEIRSFFAYDAGFTGGLSVAVGDVTGDGTADVVTGAGPGGGPHVKAFDGQSLAEVHSFFAYDAGFNGGVAVAVGDVTGDGTADITTGTWSGAPHVKVFADGAETRSFFAFAPDFAGGVRVAVGDMNGDGFAEVVAGQASGGDRVRTFDGQTGTRRFDFAAFGGFAGGARVGATDADGDGLSDIAVAAGGGGGPHVRLLSGLDLSELSGFFAFDAAFLGGVNVG